jgi:hypothetical protein
MKDYTSASDPYTNSTDPATQQFLQQHLTRMVVFSPYFDGKSSWYPNGLLYIDSYSVYPGGTFGVDVVRMHPEFARYVAYSLSTGRTGRAHGRGPKARPWSVSGR